MSPVVDEVDQLIRTLIVVEATWFDLIIGAAIILNALIMALSLERDALRTADTVGIARDGGEWPSSETVFLVFEHLFTLFFLSELILKLVVYGLGFFKTKMNLLDFIIVLGAVLETYFRFAC